MRATIAEGCLSYNDYSLRWMAIDKKKISVALLFRILFFFFFWSQQKRRKPIESPFEYIKKPEMIFSWWCSFDTFTGRPRKSGNIKFDFNVSFICPLCLSRRVFFLPLKIDCFVFSFYYSLGSIFILTSFIIHCLISSRRHTLASLSSNNSFMKWRALQCKYLVRFCFWHSFALCHSIKLNSSTVTLYLKYNSLLFYPCLSI